MERNEKDKQHDQEIAEKNLAQKIKAEGLAGVVLQAQEFLSILNANQPYCIPLLRELLKSVKAKTTSLANFKKSDFPLQYLQMFVFTDQDHDTMAGFVLEFVRFYFSDAFLGYDGNVSPVVAPPVHEEKMNELAEIERTFEGCEGLAESLQKYIHLLKEQIIDLSALVLDIPNHTHKMVQEFSNGSLETKEWYLEGVYIPEAYSIKNSFTKLDHNLKLVRERTLGQKIIAMCSILARDCLPILQNLHWNSVKVPNHVHLLFFGDPHKNRDERTLSTNSNTMQCGEVWYPKEVGDPFPVPGYLQFCKEIRNNVLSRPPHYIDSHRHRITNPITGAATQGLLTARVPSPINFVGCKLIDEQFSGMNSIRVPDLKELVLWKKQINQNLVAVSGILFKSVQGLEQQLGPHVGTQSSTFVLLPEEYIKKVFVHLKRRAFGATVIIHVGFITNTGREFYYGSEKNIKHNYIFIAPDGYKITGFYGRENDSALQSLNPIIERTDLKTELSYSK